MSAVVLVPGCDFHARSRSDLGLEVLRCQEVVCANKPGCGRSPRLASPLAYRWVLSPAREARRCERQTIGEEHAME